MDPKFEKIHEDKRGGIYLVNNLLDDGKEFTFLETKTGYSRGGCRHSNDEYLVVVKGKIRYMYGDKEEIISSPESRLIPAGVVHGWIALEDSILAEWGITTEEKRMDVKDPQMRGLIDKINSGA